MESKNILFLIFFSISYFAYGQVASQASTIRAFSKEQSANIVSKKFSSTSDFLDAAISSINAFNSLIKKENYRTKIASFNNPTSADMGFSLENEIQTALKPLLAKAKSTNPNKFSEVVSSLVNTQSKMPVAKTALTTINPVFTTLVSLVGTLTVQEKKITREDLDSFITTTSKYFVQYQKLNNANLLFDQNIERLNSRLKDLQFDCREYLLDIVVILHKNVQRNQLKNLNTEEILLKYLDKQKLETILDNGDAENAESLFRYPSDGIKNAKDIANNLQKLFNEYQKLYGENYQQVRTILLESKSLGKNINTKQVDASLKELEELYNESKNADVLSLRLNTLSERLKNLVVTEQSLVSSK